MAWDGTWPRNFATGAPRGPQAADLPGVTPIALDITDPASLAAAARAASGVAILVNDAGSSTGSSLAVGLFSRCTGGNSTFCAMVRWPAAFDGVRCLVSPQPITTAIIIQHRMAVSGIADRLDDFTSIVRLRTGSGSGNAPPRSGPRASACLLSSTASMMTC
jgi:hypothetical protein